MTDATGQTIHDSGVGFLGGTHDHHYEVGSFVSTAFTGGQHNHYSSHFGLQMVRLEQTRHEGGRAESAPQAVRSGRLLDPRHAAVPYLETEAFRDLDSWVDAAPRRAARVIFGQGGAGKSRTALEVASRAADRGWLCWSAQHGLGPLAIQPEAAPADASGSSHLIVVDYADRWSRSELTALIRSFSPTQGRIRLLLTARDLTPWPIVRQSLEDDGFSCSILEILPFLSPSDSGLLYEGALSAFGAILGASQMPSTLVDWRGGELPLTVLGAGLLCVLDQVDPHGPSHPSGDAPTWSEVSTRLLAREIDHWVHLAQDALVRTSSDPRELHLASLLAALVGPVGFDDAVRLLDQAGLRSPARVASDHSRAYPGGSPDEYLVPLSPDRLAEDLVASSLSGSPTANALVGWRGAHIEAAVARLFETVFEGASLEEDPQKYPEPLLRRAMLRMLEGGGRWDALLAHLSLQIARRPALAAVAGSPVVSAISSRLDLSSLLGVSSALDQFSSGDMNLDMYPGGLQVSESIVQHQEFDALPVSRRIDELVRLATTLKNVGRLTEASEWAAQAGELIRSELSWKGTPQLSLISEPDTVASLGDLESPRDTAVALASLADIAGANGDPEMSDLYLATSLAVYTHWNQDTEAEKDNLSYVTILQAVARNLAEAGSAESAALVEKKLYDLQFAWYLKDPAPTRLPRLSVSANNLGVWMAEIGMPDEGLALLRQAVEMRSVQVARDPMSWLPSLTESLHNLAATLSDLDRDVDALPVIKETIDLRNALFAEVGQPFVDALSRSLSVLLKVAAKLEDSAEIEAGLLNLATLAGRAHTPQTIEIVRSAACKYPGLLWGWGQRIPAVRFVESLSIGAVSTQHATTATLAAIHLAWHACHSDDYAVAGDIVRLGAACFGTCDASQIKASIPFRLALVLGEAAQDWDARADLLLLVSRNANGLLSGLDSEERRWLVAALGGSHAQMLEARRESARQLAANLAGIGSELAEVDGGKATLAAFFHNASVDVLYEDPALAVRCSRLAVELFTAIPPVSQAEVSNHSAALSILSCALRATHDPDLRTQALEAAQRSIEVAMTTPRRTVAWASNLSMCYSNFAFALVDCGHETDYEAAAAMALHLRTECVEVAGSDYIDELALAWTLYASIGGFDAASPPLSLPTRAALRYAEIKGRLNESQVSLFDSARARPPRTRAFSPPDA